jgi:hypothetical protein
VFILIFTYHKHGIFWHKTIRIYPCIETQILWLGQMWTTSYPEVEMWIDRDTATWKIQGELWRFERRPFPNEGILPIHRTFDILWSHVVGIFNPGTTVSREKFLIERYQVCVNKQKVTCSLHACPDVRWPKSIRGVHEFWLPHNLINVLIICWASIFNKSFFYKLYNLLYMNK